MATRNKLDINSTTIIEAVESLSSIADLDFEEEGRLLAPMREIVIGDEVMIPSKSAEWLQEQDIEATVERVRVFFHVILNYLRRCYKKESQLQIDHTTFEGIKAIMLLVGEAAKKMEQYAELVTGNNQIKITSLHEYKQLQEFYRKKIERRLESRDLTKWVVGLATATFFAKEEEELKIETSPTKHMFVDFDSVKKDSEYELLFMRKEDGTRFFSPKLLRNIKLVCDFGLTVDQEKETDPIIDLPLWQDHIYFTSAKNILRAISRQLDPFYHETLHHKEMELVVHLNKTLLALMLAANSSNQIQYAPRKTCQDYFLDFQIFLRETIKSPQYQHFLAYPPKKKNALGNSLMELTHGICKAIFSELRWIQEILFHIDQLLHEAVESEKINKINKETALWSRIAHDYAALGQLLKMHANGPLVKILEQMNSKSNASFDSIVQHNLPNFWYDLQASNLHISNLRIPSPTCQELIQKASVTDEFKGFILSYARNNKKHLLINLQDSTSWREYSRCQILEHLENIPECNKHIFVNTLAVDSEFYNQTAPYDTMNHADLFLEVFKEHLSGEGTGYHFSQIVKKELFSHFVDKTFQGIHKIFFNSKTILSKQNRLDFISIFYLFLELKLIDIVHPISFSFTCKDDVDISAAATAYQFAFLKLLQKEMLSEMEMEYLNLILYGPSLVIRERMMLPEILNRLVNALKVVENIRSAVGVKEFVDSVHEHFDSLYKLPLLHAHVQFPVVRPTLVPNRNRLAA